MQAVQAVGGRQCARELEVERAAPRQQDELREPAQLRLAASLHAGQVTAHEHRRYGFGRTAPMDG